MRRRIFLATIDARLIALDAATGKPCADFGEQRRRSTSGRACATRRVDRYAEYEETSPPAVVDDVVVVGSGVADNGRADAPAARCAASTRAPAR